MSNNLLTSWSAWLYWWHRAARASAYLQMKYIRNKLAEDNECITISRLPRWRFRRNCESVHICGDGNVNLEIISKSDNWLMRSFEIHWSRKKLKPKCRDFLCWWWESHLSKAYQALSLDKNCTNVLSITEPDMAKHSSRIHNRWLACCK